MNKEFQREDPNGIQSASLLTLFLPNEAEIIPNDIPSPIFITVNADIYETLYDVTAGGSPPLGTTVHNLFLRDPYEPSVILETDRVPAGTSPTFVDEKGETGNAAGTITEDETSEVSDSTGPKATIAVGEPPLAVSQPFPEQHVSLPRPMAAATPPGEHRLRIPRPTIVATPPPRLSCVQSISNAPAPPTRYEKYPGCSATSSTSVKSSYPVVLSCLSGRSEAASIYV